MHMRTISIVSLAALSCAVLAYETATILWTPKTGTTLKYESVTTLPGHGGGEMEIFETVVHKTVSVSKDKVVVEEQTELDKVLAEGQDVTSQMGRQGPEKRTLTLSTAGTVLSREGATERALANPRIDRVMAFVFPKNPVEPGTKWSVKLLAVKDLAAVEGTLTYVGLAEIAGKKAYKVKAEVAEVGVSEAVSATRTLWLSTTDGSLIKSESKLRNMPMPHGMGPVDATIVWTLGK